jgi:hypothetical protein
MFGNSLLSLLMFLSCACPLYTRLILTYLMKFFTLFNSHCLTVLAQSERFDEISIEMFLVVRFCPSYCRSISQRVQSSTGNTYVISVKWEMSRSVRSFLTKSKMKDGCDAFPEYLTFNILLFNISHSASSYCRLSLLC